MGVLTRRTFIQQLGLGIVALPVLQRRNSIETFLESKETVFESKPLDHFRPNQSFRPELWRLTNNPTVRDHTGYHNTERFSHDGRYLCYTHYAANDKEFGTPQAAEIHIYDFLNKKDIKVNNGLDPHWARNHDWLFYVHFNQNEPDATVYWLDLEQGETHELAKGPFRLGEVDFRDRWIFGYKRLEDNNRSGVRIPIRPNIRAEDIGGNGSQWITNPAHPLVVTRVPNRDTDGNIIPFVPTRLWCDLDGSNTQVASPSLQQCHQSWSGDGTYFLHGNALMAGRKWDEPFPSNLNILASIESGDLSPCGRSGRWLCGSTSGGRGALRIADIQSGDGWEVVESHSLICFPGEGDNSGPYDIDPYGSPDGTKIAFISTYDLIDGISTVIAKPLAGGRLEVESTEGFPNQGRLAIAGEVLSYSKKTATSFDGLKRGLYGTPQVNRSAGEPVTSFEARLIPEEYRKNLPLPDASIRSVIPDENSPLRLQRSSDVYVAVVRLPDQPCLREIDGHVELIPGENHWEIRGYQLFLNGQPVSGELLQPGSWQNVARPGEYRVAAVEWSGLVSEKSNPLTIAGSQQLYIRPDKPADFSWTQEHWLVNGSNVTEEVAHTKNSAIKEIVHLVEGVTHREWYRYGQITKRHDLNSEGKAIRRLFYRDGTLQKRVYVNNKGDQKSTELFDADGKYITESIIYIARNGEQQEAGHFWYEKGMPVKFIGWTGGRQADKKGYGIYQKIGDDWVKTKDLT